ncbi:MAG: 6-carboxytetrahydropterin synthase QueD [Candidatus Omnitrophica bacterium]|nr:6-carboxytetrahydropterin synthase QueD [Candidatus Omnitrophota bacterium]MBL7152032.1 6-carboxytetrahydropterin synthase QueD [Candidatus Omnitrophota bacterium]
MFSVKVEANFSSAHNLRAYKGKCESLHGHNWKIEVTACAERLDKAGMVVDFKVLRKRLYACLEKLDHKYLNEIPYFKKANPTSENIARYIYETLKGRVKNIKSVTVWENDSSCATYEE